MQMVQQSKVQTQSDWGVTYAQVAGEKTLLQSREPMRLLRVERDRLLAETDWMGNSDVTMSSDVENI